MGRTRNNFRGHWLHHQWIYSTNVFLLLRGGANVLPCWHGECHCMDGLLHCCVVACKVADVQVVDALFSDDITKEVKAAAFAFLVVGGISLLMSILEMGLFIWSGVPLTEWLHQQAPRKPRQHAIELFSCKTSELGCAGSKACADPLQSTAPLCTVRSYREFISSLDACSLDPCDGSQVSQV